MEAGLFFMRLVNLAEGTDGEEFKQRRRAGSFTH